MNVIHLKGTWGSYSVVIFDEENVFINIITVYDCHYCHINHSSNVCYLGNFTLNLYVNNPCHPPRSPNIFSFFTVFHCVITSNPCAANDGRGPCSPCVWSIITGVLPVRVPTWWSFPPTRRPAMVNFSQILQKLQSESSDCMSIWIFLTVSRRGFNVLKNHHLRWCYFHSDDSSTLGDTDKFFKYVIGYTLLLIILFLFSCYFLLVC